MAKQNGFLMIVVAIMIIIIAGFASTFVSMSIRGSNSSSSALSANNAYDLAHAGFENGSYQLTLGTCNGAWSSIVTVSGLGEYQYNCTLNRGLTTTTAALTLLSSTIPLASITGLASFGAMTIESETIYYDGFSGTTLQNVRRGQNGTTAATHVMGSFASQSQYIITSQGGAPSLTSPNGKVTLSQAVLLMAYYAAGTNGSNGIILNYNGVSWSTVLTGPSTFTFWGINNSTAYGQAVGYTSGNAGSIYTFNGSTWVLGTGPLVNMQFLDVSCDSPSNLTTCWAVGNNRSIGRALMYRYLPGSGYTDAQNNYTLTGVTCDSGRCMSVGSNHTYYFGSSTVPFPSVRNLSRNLNDVDCTPNHCIIVRTNSAGTKGYVYNYNRSTSTFSSAFEISSGGALNAVSCPSSTNCIVVGNFGKIFNCVVPITSVGSCTVQTSPATLINLLDVHCNSPTDCLAVGVGTVAYRYTGGVWSTVSLPASYTLNTVSGTNASGQGVTPTVWHNQ